MGTYTHVVLSFGTLLFISNVWLQWPTKSRPTLIHFSLCLPTHPHFYRFPGTELVDYELILNQETLDIYNFIIGRDPLPEVRRRFFHLCHTFFNFVFCLRAFAFCHSLSYYIVITILTWYMALVRTLSFWKKTQELDTPVMKKLQDFAAASPISSPSGYLKAKKDMSN